MKRLFTLTLLSLFAFSLHAVDIYSIADGSWSNTSTVWSYDGTTPCSCSPGTNPGDRIFVRHDINLNVDITVTATGDISIDSGARLYNGSYEIENNGLITNNGTFGMKAFRNMAGATMNNNNDMTVINGNLENFGTFDNSGPLTVVNGNLDCDPGSSLTVGASIRIQMLNGNVYNGGLLTFMGAGACIIIDNGNYYNEVTGETAGTGGVNASGNVYNDGIWGANVDWCAGGSGSGSQPLPPENCAAVCNGPFPIVLADFDVEMVDGSAKVTWTTASETNTDYFAIERRVAYADEDFVEIGRVEAAGNSSSLLSYEYTDAGIVGPSIEYRLKAMDIEGQYEYSEVVEIYLGTASIDIVTYPNPAYDLINVRINSWGSTTAEVTLADVNGKIVRKLDWQLERGPQEITMDLNGLLGGIYVVRVCQGVKHSMQTVIIGN